jgi:hypothetical protein
MLLARSRAAHWPAGLIGAIGLILLLEGPIARLPVHPDPRTRLAASWANASREATGPESRADILCLGDSQIKLGIVPRILEARLGQSVYNLAVLGGQPPTSHYLLRGVLDRGHHPRALVVNFSPLLLGMNPRVHLEWWAGLARGRERLDLLLRAGEPGLAISLILHGAVASLSSREAFREALGFGGIGSDGGEERPEGDEIRALLRNWCFNRGAQVAPRPFVPIRGSLPRPYDGPDWRWQPNPVQAYFVERFLANAQERAIPVYWIIPPADAEWLERNRGVGTVGAYRSYVRGLVGRFPVLTVFDLQEAGWDRRWFRDPIHLNRDGAIRLSLAVAEAMARAQGAAAGAGRWITMDGGGTVPLRRFQEMLEDLDQSRLAVGRGESGPITMEGPVR